VIWNDLFGARKERTVAVPYLNSLSLLCGLLDSEGCQGLILLATGQRLALESVARDSLTATAATSS